MREQFEQAAALRAENERLRKMIAEAEAVGYGSVMCAALKGEKG